MALKFKLVLMKGENKTNRGKIKENRKQEQEKKQKEEEFDLVYHLVRSGLVGVKLCSF